jgi:hypothetical protein
LNIIQVSHVGYQLLLKVRLIEILSLLVIHLVLRLEETDGQLLLKVAEVGDLTDFEEIAWDVAIASGIAKEIDTLLLDIDLEISH